MVLFDLSSIGAVAEKAVCIFERDRRRSVDRSAASTCRERIPKKLAVLYFGRGAMPAQKTQIVQKLRQSHFLKILFSIAQLLPAIFYYHLKRMERTDRHETARAEITAIYHENKGRYDYRRITVELHNRSIPFVTPAEWERAGRIRCISGFVRFSTSEIPSGNEPHQLVGS